MGMPPVGPLNGRWIPRPSDAAAAAPPPRRASLGDPTGPSALPDGARLLPSVKLAGRRSFQVPLLGERIMKTARLVVCAGLSLALVAGFMSTRKASGEASEADNVRKSCGAIVAGWNSHDAKAIVARFDPDADMITPEGEKVSGRDAIEKAFTAMHTGKGAMRDSKVEVKDEPVRFPTADIAVSDASIVVTGAYNPDGSKAGPVNLVVTNVWKKTNGEWYVYSCREHLVTTPPATPK